MHIEEIIKRPLLFTEKGDALQSGHNQYVFEVDLRANKIQIKDAVETLFDVHVTSVNTLIVRGKPRRIGRKRLKTPNWKKAIVSLAGDDSISFYEGS